MTREIPSALDSEPGGFPSDLKKVMVMHELDLYDHLVSHYSLILREKSIFTKVLAGKSKAQRSGGVLHTAAVIGYIGS